MSVVNETKTDEKPVENKVVFEQIGALAIARLNAEKSLNALSLDMIDLLLPQLLAWQQDDSVSVIWLEGTGNRAFCAGGDVVSLHQSASQASADGRNRQAEAFFTREYTLDYLLYGYGKPIICWADGVVMGGGLGLLAGCSHRIGTPNSRIAMPEITIGLYPDVGASRFLSRMPGDMGLFLGLTGASINANDAHYVGLVDHVLASEQREPLKQTLAQMQFDADARQLDAQVSRLLRQQGLPLSDWPADNLRSRFDLITHLCDADTLPDVVANICGYAGDDAWLSRAAKTLAAGSPLSAWLVWIAQQQAAGKSLAEVLRMEWIVSMNCVLKGDLHEGVRALLVDKDKTPRFQHASVEDISEEFLASFFELPANINEHPLAELGGSL